MAKLILGLDEVGRGPIAGPLVIGACILSPFYLENNRLNPREEWQNELTDSKALSEARREKLDPIIREKALAYGLGWVPAEELDAVGVSTGLELAARRAVEDLRNHFPDISFDEIIIDGITNFLVGTPYARAVTTVVKADFKIKAVSAASIIAKVARDHYMIAVAGAKYPKYEFARHKGYGTQVHWQKLQKNGPCPEHRWTIARIRKAYPPRPLDFTTAATEKVPENERFVPAKYLESHRKNSLSLHLFAMESPTAGSSKASAKSSKTGPVKSTTAIGSVAEQKTAEYLEKQGHKILSRNFRRKSYEIDLVSATANHIYFTEVKYRSSDASGAPVEAITKTKLSKMRYAADCFMQELARRLKRSADSLPSPTLAVSAVDKSGKIDWFEIAV